MKKPLHPHLGRAGKGAPEPVHYKGGIFRPTPYGTWRAEINNAGTRHRDCFDTVKQCEAWVDRELPRILENTRPLTAEEIAEYRTARGILPGGVGLIEAARAYNPGPAWPDAPIPAATERFLAEKTASGLRPRSVYGLRWSLTRLVKHLGDAQLCDITPDTLRPLLEGLKPITRDNHRRAWSTFFRWAIASGLRAGDPTAPVGRLRTDATEPRILTVPQARALMAAAEATDAGSMAGYLALGLFAGIRTSGLQLIDWADVKPDLIRIRPGVDKLRSARFVEVQPNLAAWIRAHRRPGRVCPYAPKKAFEILVKVRQTAELAEWPKNCMRHSFASYLLAMLENPGKVAHEMGQRSPDMLFQHYRALVTAADAKAYFRIRPASTSCPAAAPPSKKPSKPRKPAPFPS